MRYFYRLLAGVFLFSLLHNLSEAQVVKYLPKQYISNATQYAITNFSPNATLYAIASAYGLDSTGKAWAWQYLFYNPANDSGYMVSGPVVNPIGFIPVGMTTPALPGVFLRPLGTSFCESNLAIAAAEDGGGRQFRNQHPATRISATVYKYPLAPDTSRAYWTYLYIDTLGTQFQAFLVDGTTCALVVIGIRPISSEVPDNFALYQNYPNPFNPTTKIKFAVPKTGYVNISVFDVLGNEVDQPVNQTLQAGVYETDFDASNLASGVYFYRMSVSEQTGSPERYIKTMKMLLVK